MRLTRLILLLCLGFASPLQGQTADTNDTGSSDVLTVGTKIAPPFVVERADGELAGISIDLWRLMADAEGWQYEFERSDLEELVDGTAAGKYDVAVGALTATAAREARLDFAHPFYSTGLAIAVTEQRRGLLAALADNLFSQEFLGALSGLMLLLLVVGFIVWLVERRKNPDEFGGSAADGIGAGFWWAAVTMTTVGYGDKAPATFLGRVVGLVWMFAAIIVISGFTAAIASSLTVEQMGGDIRGPDDLRGVAVGSVPGSSSAEHLAAERIRYLDYGSVDEAVAALARGDINAVVYDAPILRYQIGNDYQGVLDVLPGTFARQDYAMAVPADSPLREEINRVLLEMLGSSDWNDIRYRYLGD